MIVSDVIFMIYFVYESYKEFLMAALLSRDTNAVIISTGFTYICE